MIKSSQISLPPQNAFLNPSFITLILMIVLVIGVILANGGDPLVLARIGTIYDPGDSQGTEGYDGQFVYYIARDPSQCASPNIWMCLPTATNESCCLSS